ncbi:MAG TPA: hypothetical protein VLA90_05110 [Actinomycetota bacterium]|nr:hypothetical protein [Actinomycetota bacterium]
METPAFSPRVHYGDAAVDEQRRVRVPLGIELRVKGSDADLHLPGHDGVERQDRDAVGIGPLEVPIGDRLLDELDVEDRDVRVELARDDDVVPVG